MKKYIVSLSDAERKTCREAINKLKGSSQKALRARILLQIDADGPGWCDLQVAEAYDCRERTVANVRRSCVLEGFDLALNGRQQNPSTRPPKRTGGRRGAARIALRMDSSPDGDGEWSLRLIGPDGVEVGICESISHETVNQTSGER